MEYICEQCGHPAALCVSDWGYIAALCDECRTQRKDDLKLPGGDAHAGSPLNNGTPSCPPEAPGFGRSAIEQKCRQMRMIRIDKDFSDLYDRVQEESLVHLPVPRHHR